MAKGQRSHPAGQIANKNDSWVFATALRAQIARLSLGPIGAVFNPLAQHADLHVGETYVRPWHQLRMGAQSLHCREHQTAFGFAGDDVCLTPSVGLEGRLLAGKIQRGRREFPVMTAQTILLQDRLDLGQEIMVLNPGLGFRGEGTGNQWQDKEDAKRLHEGV